VKSLAARLLLVLQQRDFDHAASVGEAVEDFILIGIGDHHRRPRLGLNGESPADREVASAAATEGVIFKASAPFERGVEEFVAGGGAAGEVDKAVVGTVAG